MIEVGLDAAHMLALYLSLLDADLQVTEPAELVEHLRRPARPCWRAVTPGSLR